MKKSIILLLSLCIFYNFSVQVKATNRIRSTLTLKEKLSQKLKAHEEQADIRTRIKNKIKDIALFIKDNKFTPQLKMELEAQFGKVADFESAERKRKAREDAEKRMIESKFQGSLKQLTDPLRFCVFPVQHFNYDKFCKQLQPTNNLMQRDCDNTFCKMCCDLGPDILKTTANNSIVAKDLGLQAEPGANIIDKLITFDEIEMCRNNCQVEYPMTEPTTLPPPKKLALLGNPGRPARSCWDIKLHRMGQLKDDVQLIESDSGGDEADKKTEMPVYCDMTADGGGWMLALNQSHNAGSPTEVLTLNDASSDGVKMPKSTNDNMHINLKMVGWEDPNDAYAVRFVCSGKRINKEKNTALDPIHKFINFKVEGDEGISNTLIHGVQKDNLDTAGFVAGIPQGLEGIPSMLKEHSLFADLNIENASSDIPNKVNFVGSDDNGAPSPGGFVNRPFGHTGGNNGDSYWSVKGSGNQWECGYAVSEDDAGLYSTLHQVWVRPNTEVPDDENKTLSSAILSMKEARGRAKGWDKQ